MPYIGQSLTEGTRREYTYVATASQTTFNAIYTVGAVDVYQNGVLLAPSDYTATTGTTVVFNTGAALNDEITIHCHNTFSVADTVSASQGGTFSGAVTHTGAFTSRGIDDNAASTAMTLDASGNLLVGKTSADNTAGATIKADGEGYFVKSNGAGLSANRLSSDGAIQYFFKDTSLVGSIGTGLSGGSEFGIKSNTGELQLATSYNSNVVTWDGSQLYPSASNSLGFSGQPWQDLYLSGGVYLGGTGSANLLDDYEEGTFTPTFSASGYSFSYNTQVGSYVKVGKLVSVCMYLRLSGSPSGSGSVALTITGLPFGIADDGSQNYTSAAIIVEGSGSLFSGVPFVRPNRNTTSAMIADYAGGSGPNFYKSWTGMTSGMEWEIQFNYFTNN